MDNISNNLPAPMVLDSRETEVFARILRINNHLESKSERLAHLAFEEHFAAERDLFERAAHIRDYARVIANS
jgi:hypothetical protein